MSDEFNARFAAITDSPLIARHRARMFQDMGYVPAELFDYFRAKSEARLREALACEEYIGWLASQRNSPETIIAGAGVRLRRILPHPIGEADGEITICDGRQGIILNVFTEPEWRRRGIAALLMNTIIEWSREQRRVLCGDGAQVSAEPHLICEDETEALVQGPAFVGSVEDKPIQTLVP